MNLRPWIVILFTFVFLVGCSANAEQETPAPKDDASDEAEDSRVVTIGDKTFDRDDLAFYTLMSQIKLTLEKTAAKSESERTYYEEQLAYYENINVNLQSLIELYSMSLLAEEKNYFVPEEKLHDAVVSFKEKVGKNDESTALVEDFGLEKYNRHIEEYIRQTILRDRVVKELEAELKEEKPEATEREINYLLEKKFEDLYMDQTSSLEMEINLQ